MGGNFEDSKSDLLDETDNNAAANSVAEMLIKHTTRKRLLASRSLLALKEEWFCSYGFPVDTPISDKKYRYPRSNHENSFYPFNDQQDYAIAHYFADSETTKGNMNKFLIDLLITPLTKKLSYKNADK